MPRAIEYAIELEPIECGMCGILFAVPATFHKKRLNDHQTWWCPNGHPRAFKGETEEERLRREVKRYEAHVSTLKAEVAFQRDQKEAAERSLRSTKAQLTKTKKRIANGVCPCCHRTFQNLAKHMAGQHPEYQESE